MQATSPILAAADVVLGPHTTFLYCSTRTPIEAEEVVPGSVLCNLLRVTSLKHLKGLIEQFQSEVEKIVCYQQKGIDIAAQVWWLLLVLGYENVQVLDGGLEAYKSAEHIVEVRKLADPPVQMLEGEIDRSKYKVNSEVQTLLSSSIRNFQLIDTDGTYRGAVDCPASLFLTEDGCLSDSDSMKLVLSGMNIRSEPLDTSIVIGRNAPTVLLALASLGMQHLCLGIVDREQKDEFLDVPIGDRRQEETAASFRTEFYSVSSDTEFFDAMGEETSQRAPQRDSLVATRKMNSPKVERKLQEIRRQGEPAESQHTCSGCLIC